MTTIDIQERQVIDFTAVKDHNPNPGLPLDEGFINRLRINRSAVERRAGSLVTRRSLKKAVAGGLVAAGYLLH